MAQFDLYVDTYSGELVSGISNSSPGQLPKLVQGDTIALRIYLLARTPTYPLTTPFTIIPANSVSIKVAIGPKDGTAGSTLYTQQFTWVPDAGNQYNAANLALNTAAITILIGTGTSGTAYFEIELTQGGFPTTVFQKSVTIEAEVIETGVVTVPAGATAISAEEVNALFVKLDESRPIILRNAAQTVAVLMYLGDDGVVHFDPYV